jgi:hypothetical protein
MWGVGEDVYKELAYYRAEVKEIEGCLNALEELQRIT